VFRQIYQTVSSVENSKSFSNHNSIKLLQKLHQARATLTKGYIVGANNLIGPLIKSINQYIILVSEVMSEEGLDNDIGKALLGDIKHFAITTCITYQVELPQLPTSPAVQPRHDIAKALSGHLPRAVNNSFVHAMRIAFQCFDCRIQTISKWYEKYFNIVTNHPEISSNESIFFVAVQELVHCGFIRKLTSARRKDDAYEKIAMVWG
jgi:hypothetical protein